MLCLGLDDILSSCNSPPSSKEALSRHRIFARLVAAADKLYTSASRKDRYAFWIAVPYTPSITSDQDELRIRFNDFLTRNYDVFELHTIATDYPARGTDVEKLEITSKGYDRLYPEFCDLVLMRPAMMAGIRYAPQVTMFYKGGPSHFLSSFFYCSIVTSTNIFVSLEQYFQYHKALFCNDDKAANDILMSDTNDDFKWIGRGCLRMSVKQRKAWDVKRVDVMYAGIVLKFEDPLLRQQLLDTGDTYIAQMSPYDTYWGTGILSTSPKRKLVAVEEKIEYNKLGQLLMALRSEISGEYFNCNY